VKYVAEFFTEPYSEESEEAKYLCAQVSMIWEKKRELLCTYRHDLFPGDRSMVIMSCNESLRDKLKRDLNARVRRRARQRAAELWWNEQFEFEGTIGEVCNRVQQLIEEFDGILREPKEVEDEQNESP